MINATSNDVIVHINFEPATLRFAGAERYVLRPATNGFCWVEFSDGEQHPISHPLEEWILSIINQGVTPGTSQIGTIHFVIDTPGERSNDGQDNKQTSVNNIQSAF